MYLAPKEVARRLGVTVKTVRAWCRRGRVVCHQAEPGGAIRVEWPIQPRGAEGR